MAEVKSNTIEGQRQLTWLTFKESAKFLNKSEVDLKEMVAIGFFKLSIDKNLIERESIEEYLQSGIRHRLSEFQETLKINQKAEEERNSLQLELIGLEAKKKELEASNQLKTG